MTPAQRAATPTLRELAQQFVQDYENGDLGDMKHYARPMRAALAEQAAEQASEAANGDVLWLWKNGDHFLAFKHLYPCYSPGGDPMVLGEPFGRAEFRASHDRAAPAAEQAPHPSYPHITQPYTLEEIRAQIASHDYSAELLLQHAMLLLDAAEQAEPVAWALTKQLEKRETTTNGYLWFSDPQNSSWEPLYRKAPAPARQEWQPIETAPKDGRKIMLSYRNRNGKPRAIFARWLTDEQVAETDADGVGLEGGWYECIDNCDEYTEFYIHEGDPTHWRPLPAAPITAAPVEGGA